MVLGTDAEPYINIIYYVVRVPTTTTVVLSDTWRTTLEGSDGDSAGVWYMIKLHSISDLTEYAVNFNANKFIVNSPNGY